MPEWGRGAVIYQIYPRSFADSNGDGVGDLKGVIAKLDHVAALGVDGVWLSPVFTSPMKDFGYDVADYCAIDPLFGTMADFDALIARAHDLGLKIIIDQVYAHTSDAHAWFTQSRASRDNPKADWYVWADAKPDGSAPNNWQSLFGGPSWEWDPRRRQYYLHNFLREQPDLNVRHLGVQDALLDVARFWLDRGVDGFRLDVVNFLIKDAQLRDNPPIARPAPRPAPPAHPHAFQRHLHDRSQGETLAFVARLRALLDSYGDRFVVGEIEDEDPLARQIEYTDGPDRLHSAYSFFLLRARRAAPALFKEALGAWSDARGWPSWSLSNHDVVRYPTRLAHGDGHLTRVLMAALLSLRGTIFLYQGDELGLPQAHVPYERLRDPEAIRFWPEGIGRDGARTPMPWTSDGGFSDHGEPWLPIDPAHLILNVAAQEEDSASMLALTKKLIGVRQAHPALRWGAWRPVTAPDALLTFERLYEGDGRHPREHLLCVFNFSAAPVLYSYAALRGAHLIEYPLHARHDEDRLTLPAHGGAIVRLA